MSYPSSIFLFLLWIHTREKLFILRNICIHVFVLFINLIKRLTLFFLILTLLVYYLIYLFFRNLSIYFNILAMYLSIPLFHPSIYLSCWFCNLCIYTLFHLTIDLSFFSQLNICTFKCQHLYGFLFAPIFYSRAENALFGAI